MCFPIVFSVALAVCGWWAGRNVGSPEFPNLRLESNRWDVRTADGPPPATSATHRLDATSLPSEIKGVLTATTPLLQRHQLYKLAVQLTPEDFPAALVVLRAGGGEEGAKLYNDLAAFWFEKDLPSAKAWLASLTPAEREKVFAAVFPTWGQVDVADLFAWLKTQPNEGQTGLASSHRLDLAKLLAKSDPAAAAEFLSATEPPPSMNAWNASAAEWEVFREWGKRDPHAASSLIGDVPSGRRRMAAMRGLVEAWTEQNPVEVEAWLATLTDAPLIREASKTYIYQRAQLNPAAAADYMLMHWMPEYEDVDSGPMSGLIWSWARQDEVAALAWVKALPDLEMREQGLYDFMNAAASDDPAHAAELWLAEFGDGTDGSGWSSARYIARELATDTGFDAALDFLAKVPKMRTLTIEQFLGAVVPRFGAVATAEAILRRPATPDRLEYIRPIFQRLVGEGRMPEARQFLGSLPAGAERQAAISGLLAGELRLDPDGALELAQSLVGSDGSRLFRDELAKVYQPHKTELKEWLQKTPLLTPGEKQRILKRPGNGDN